MSVQSHSDIIHSLASLLFASLEFAYVCVYTFQFPLARNFVSSLRLYVPILHLPQITRATLIAFATLLAASSPSASAVRLPLEPVSPIAISSDLPSSDSLSFNLLTHSDPSAPKRPRVLALSIYLRIVLRSTFLHHYAFSLFSMVSRLTTSLFNV